MSNEKQQKDHNNREKQQKRVLCINCYNKQNQGNHEDKVIDEHQKRDPEVSDEQTLEDFGDCGDGGGKGDSFIGVEGSDGEDDGGGGEEREGEEEEKVAELDCEEKGPFMVSLGRILIRVLELSEEWVCEE